MNIRTGLVIVLVCGGVLVAGYRLNQVEPEVVTAAAPAFRPVKASLHGQATTVEEVAAQRRQPLGEQMVVYKDAMFGYHLSHPLTWQDLQLSANVAVFQSPDQVTQVKVEAVGPLPADGLTAFVERSVDGDKVISHQMLTIHGLSAERVLTYSANARGQVTTFFIDAGDSAYVLTGVGEQKAIEQVIRSFNGPELIAQH